MRDFRSSLATAEPDWIPSGKVIVLAQEALKGDAALNDRGVPLTLSFAHDDQNAASSSSCTARRCSAAPMSCRRACPRTGLRRCARRSAR